jgi:hypothetical protein
MNPKPQVLEFGLGLSSLVRPAALAACLGPSETGSNSDAHGYARGNSKGGNMQDIGPSSVQGVAVNDTLVGFTVMSGGDDIGKIDHVNYTGTCLSIETGGLFKKGRHLIPPTAIRSIDLDDETIHVAMTAEEVEQAPVYPDDERGIDDETESLVEQYYASLPPR